MFRRDSNATFTKKGLIFRKYRFQSGRVISKKNLFIDQYKKIINAQEENPICVLEIEKTPKKWWMYKGNFYYEDEGFTAEDIKFLALDRLTKIERKLKRAKSIVEQSTSIKSDSREPIPDEVKMYVWKRDLGKCVKCGGKENLEFDHIIPFSKGGSNTARNLQLLCLECNRSKGDSLV